MGIPWNLHLFGMTLAIAWEIANERAWRANPALQHKKVFRFCSKKIRGSSVRLWDFVVILYNISSTKGYLQGKRITQGVDAIGPDYWLEEIGDTGGGRAEPL
jgi:hypothetical protein